jgi:hypothetical protein
MTWTTPTFDQLKMDAEIGSYQEDTEPRRESPIARAIPEASGESRHTRHTSTG